MKKQTYVKPDVEMFEAEGNDLVLASRKTIIDEDDAKKGFFGSMCKDSSPIFSESSASFDDMTPSSGPF